VLVSVRRVALGLLLGCALLTGGASSAPVAAQSCDPAYTSHCVPPVSEVGDLNCQYFYDQGIYGIVLADPSNDPHGLDELYDVGDGSGCEGDYEGDTTGLSGTQGIVAPADNTVAPVVGSPGTALLGPDGTYSVVDPAPSYGEPVYEESVPLAADCDPSYPDLCIPPGSADLNCDYVYGLGLSYITVYAPDPHGFDGDGDGVGCEG
jgi:hypothetical protein